MNAAWYDAVAQLDRLTPARDLWAEAVQRSGSQRMAEQNVQAVAHRNGDATSTTSATQAVGGDSRRMRGVGWDWRVRPAVLRPALGFVVVAVAVAVLVISGSWGSGAGRPRQPASRVSGASKPLSARILANHVIGADTRATTWEALPSALGYHPTLPRVDGLGASYITGIWVSAAAGRAAVYYADRGLIVFYSAGAPFRLPPSAHAYRVDGLRLSGVNWDGSGRWRRPTRLVFRADGQSVELIGLSPIRRLLSVAKSIG